MHVPIDAALTHQAGALVVLAGAVLHARGLFGRYPAPAAA
jgi:cytochrome c oxidase assembly protein subunit 15